MGTTDAHLPTRERVFRESIDTLTRVTGTALLILYAVGFIVLAFHDARYGIIGFSLLRVRILSVGALFGALVMLAAAAGYYQIEYIPTLKAVYNNAEPKLQSYRKLVLVAHFIYPATFMALLFNGIIFPFEMKNWWFVPEDASLWRAVAIFSAFVVMGFGNFVIEKSFSKHPNRAALLGLGGASLVICTLYLFGTRNIANLTLFLFLAGLNAFQLRRSVRHALDFRTWFLMALLIVLFISQIFGHTRPELGGGAPSRVTLYLNTPVTWLNGTVASVLLVDETDQGFYVLTAPTSKAFFLPRSNVASIFFGTEADLPKTRK